MFLNEGLDWRSVVQMSEQVHGSCVVDKARDSEEIRWLT
jgi:hypothetical protein